MKKYFGLRDLIRSIGLAGVIVLSACECDSVKIKPATSNGAGDIRIYERGELLGNKCYIFGEGAIRLDGIDYSPKDVVYLVNENDNLVEDGGKVECSPDDRYNVVVARKNKDILGIINDTYRE